MPDEVTSRPPTRGRRLDHVGFEVERGKIREFARATRAADPVHSDRASAIVAGFADVAATPTHVAVARHYRDQRQFVADLGLDIERIVVGSVEWEYLRPLTAGDRVSGTRRVVDDSVREGKRGGTMRLVTLETEWVTGAGDVAVRQREVLIERGA